MFGFLFDHETPRVVTIRHYKLGIFRMILQVCILAFIFIYQLWYDKGYQAFSEVQSSVTTKVKGVTYSLLSESEKTKNLTEFDISILQRVWDPADFVVPPSENNAFFVLTNAIITPNQTRGACPEDHTTIPDADCGKQDTCRKGQIRKVTSHGAETGRCVDQDKRFDKNGDNNIRVCEISGWCPVEDNNLLMETEPLLPNTENFTVYIKNTISFPWFDPSKYKRNNMPNGICIFEPSNQSTHFCPIFRLGYIVDQAKANYTKLATRGAVIAIKIKWECNLDLDFMTSCLPQYSFHILDESGWNFRHALYHEENRRTLIKAYGIKFLISVNGQAGKFDITNTVVIIVTGLGLMGLANLMCDLILLNFSNQYREKMKEKKFEQIDIADGEEVESLSFVDSIKRHSLKITNRNSLNNNNNKTNES